MIVLLGTTAIRAEKIVAAYVNDQDEKWVMVDTDNEETVYSLECESPEEAKAVLGRFVADWKFALLHDR